MLGPDHEDVALTLNEMGAYYGRLGMRQEAQALLAQALRVVNACHGGSGNAIGGKAASAPRLNPRVDLTGRLGCTWVDR